MLRIWKEVVQQRDQLFGELLVKEQAAGGPEALEGQQRERGARGTPGGYQWTQPFLLDSTLTEQTFGLTPTLIDAALAAIPTTSPIAQVR